MRKEKENKRKEGRKEREKEGKGKMERRKVEMGGEEKPKNTDV